VGLAFPTAFRSRSWAPRKRLHHGGDRDRDAHAPDFMPGTIETRPSREGKYVSLTATVNAHSREQLDALYRELCDHPPW
jgi:hypothetical protein